MGVILALVGLAVLIWALALLFKPPRKHKDFSLYDRDDATSRALGGGGVPDLSKLEPKEKEQKSIKIASFLKFAFFKSLKIVYVIKSNQLWECRALSD